jgi:hypothetical protein
MRARKICPSIVRPRLLSCDSRLYGEVLGSQGVGFLSPEYCTDSLSVIAYWQMRVRQSLAETPPVREAYHVHAVEATEPRATSVRG